MRSVRGLVLCCWIRSILFFSKIAHLTAADNDAASVGKLRSAADTLFTSGQFDQAIEMWSKVISIEPANDSNFYKRFRVYLRQQKLKEALADLNSAIKLNPSNEGAIVQRAKLNLRLGKCEDSETDLIKLRK